jgi:hypothetical protein
MKRSLFFSLIALSATLRVEPQTAIHDTSSNVKFGRSSGAKDRGTRDGSGKLYKIAIEIFHGKLKQLTDKEIVIENQSNQMVSIRRSHKTKFLRNNEPIHPSDIDTDTAIIVEVKEENRSLAALNVSVDTSATRMNSPGPPKLKPVDGELQIWPKATWGNVE